MDIHALEFVKIINTKSDKQSNIEKLGSYQYSQYKYIVEDIIPVVERILNRDYKIKVLSVFFIYYLRDNGWRNTYKEIIEHLNTNNKELAYLFLEMGKSDNIKSDYSHTENELVAMLLKKSLIHAKKIPNNNERFNLIPKIILVLRHSIKLNEFLNIIKSLERVKYDNPDSNIYEIFDNPRKASFITDEEIKEAFNRLSNDWIIWCMLSLNIPNKIEEPQLHFLFILHMCRYSKINAAIKIQFINEFIQSIRSLLNFSEEQIHELRDININFIHSQYWRRLIDYKLEQIQFEKY